MKSTIELIDKGTLYKKIKSICNGCKYFNEDSCACCSMEECADAVADAPAVDAVPVVRCKDCKHRGTESCYLYVYDAGYNEFGEDYAYEEDRTKDDFFCAKGERRVVQE